MDRRQFLTVAGCVLGLAAPGLSFGFSGYCRVHPTTAPVFIGLGDCGVNVIRSMRAGAPMISSSSHAIFAEINRTDELLARPLSANELARLEEMAVSVSRISKGSRIVMVAGLSRATGGELVVPVARRYMRDCVDFSAIVTMPFAFEGVRCRAIAEKRLACLSSLVVPVYVIDNAENFDELPHNPTLLQAYQAANDKVIALATQVAWPSGAVLSEGV